MTRSCFEVYMGTVKGNGRPLKVYDDRTTAENVADEMAMRGCPASVYLVAGTKRERVYAVSL